MALVILASLLTASEVGSQTSSGVTTRVSLSNLDANGDGNQDQANFSSTSSAISADGRFVAFTSAATNLVAGDTNGQPDVFVRDRDADGDGLFDEPGQMTTVRVSVTNSGNQAMGPPPSPFSGEPSISGDGRFVAFTTTSNLTDDDDLDGNGSPDVYVRDLVAGTTRLISVDCSNVTAAGNSSNPAITPDGRFVAFESSDTQMEPPGPGGEFCVGTDLRDVYVRDRDTDGDGVFDEPGAATTTRASVSAAGGFPNGDSTDPAISADGTVVAFESTATDLVTTDANGEVSDVYVRAGGTTTRISRASGPSGVQGNLASRDPAVSWDGRFVAFESAATNLVSGDTNGVDDVFVRDRSNNTTSRASENSVGTQGNRASGNPSLSADGRFVAFDSLARNLVGDDTNAARDVFLRDRGAGRTTRVSVDSQEDETPPATRTELAAMSADARYIAFESDATNLVARFDTDGDGTCDFECADTNEAVDVFVRDRQPVLDVDPPFVDFGDRIVRTRSAAEAIILANDGGGPLVIHSVSIGGANPASFIISLDTCSGTTLQPDDECTVNVRFRPRSMDLKTAQLNIASSASFSPSALLMGFGLHPILEVAPAMVEVGSVTFMSGTLFPLNSRIVLTWDPGLGSLRLRSNASGEIESPILVFHRDITGPRLLKATGPGVEAEVEVFVSPGSAQPPGFVNRG